MALVGLGMPVHATQGIQVRPLMYRETLRPDQAKRGFVDISNASTDKVSLHVSVRLFRQTGDNGALEFYDKPDATAGIVPEYTDFDLESRDVLRLGFTIDGTKLPQGDVFAALFVTTKPSPTKKQAIVPAVQVGTLLILQNGTLATRHAEISRLDVAQIQMGDSAIHGTVSVTNPANPVTPTGFFPQMKVTVAPWGATTQFEGPLVYAGRTRSFDFSVPSDQFGVYKVTVVANDAKLERYVFVMTGKWRVIVPVVVGLLIVIGAGGWWWKHHHRRRFSFR